MKYWYFAMKCLNFVVIPVLIVIWLRSIYYPTEKSDNEKQNSFAEKSGITYFRDQIGNYNTFTKGIQSKSVQYDFKTSDDYFARTEQ